MSSAINSPVNDHLRTPASSTPLPRDNSDRKSAVGGGGSTSTNAGDKALHAKIELWIQEAKESLSIAGPICTDANLLLSDVRMQLENASVLWAQSQYLYTALTGQIDTLKQIQEKVTISVTKNRTVFEASLGLLDEEDRKLTKALKLLESCQLDKSIEYDNLRRSFRLAEQNGINKAETPEISSIVARNLRSFVDEDAVSRLKNTITAAIDVIQQAHADAESIVRKISQKIASFSCMAVPQLVESLERVARTSSDSGEWKSGIEKRLEEAHNQTTEVATHAHAMAMLLESLARHYDQCTQAMQMYMDVEAQRKKHGKEAMDEEDGYDDLSDLVLVLENDSRELVGVIDELQDRFKDIESLTGDVQSFQIELSTGIYNKTKRTFEKLEEFGKEELVQYLEELQGYQEKIQPVKYMDEEQQKQVEYTAGIGLPLREMKSLVEYYSMFWMSYQRLVVEVERRRRFQNQMQTLIDEMTSKVEKLLTEELNTRQDFFDSVANFLPGDLWPGLLEPPPFIDFVPNGDWETPELSKSSLDVALEMLKRERDVPKKRRDEK